MQYAMMLPDKPIPGQAPARGCADLSFEESPFGENLIENW
jgi:hypothetical protein